MFPKRRRGKGVRSKSPHPSNFDHEQFCKVDHRNSQRKYPWTWRGKMRLNKKGELAVKFASNIPVIREPRAEGLSIPNMATTMVIMPISPIWMPEPIRAHKMVDCAGGRKISPWTNFQPVSSSVSSSSSSSLLYWAISRRRVRTEVFQYNPEDVEKSYQ